MLQSPASKSKATEDDIKEIMESVRYDDDEDVHIFLQKFSEDEFWCARNSSNNTVFHYMAANGFSGLIETTLKLTSAQPETSSQAFIYCISAFNDKMSSCLHWAALNGQLDCIKLICERLELFPSTAVYSMRAKKPRTLLTDVLNARNEHKRTPFDEAEVASKEDVVVYLLSKMDEIENPDNSSAAEGAVKEDDDADENVPDADEGEEQELVLTTEHEPISPAHAAPVSVNLSDIAKLDINTEK